MLSMGMSSSNQRRVLSSLAMWKSSVNIRLLSGESSGCQRGARPDKSLIGYPRNSLWKIGQLSETETCLRCAGLVQVFWVRGGDSFHRSRHLFLEPVVEPFFQLLLGLFRDIVEAQPGPAFDVGPDYLGFDVELELRLGQRELQAWHRPFRQRLPQH